MKNILFILSLVACSFVTQAQVNASLQAVDANDVPAAVISSQATYFPGITVTVWEKQSTSARSKSAERYVANFRNNGQKARAKYTPNGAGTTAITYYSGSKLPAAIQNAVATNYAGYTLTSGEEIIALQKDETYFRLRLRKGAQKLVVYVDENGNELSAQQVPDEVEEA